MMRLPRAPRSGAALLVRLLLLRLLRLSLLLLSLQLLSLQLFPEPPRAASAAPAAFNFTDGDLVVYRVGTGSEQSGQYRQPRLPGRVHARRRTRPVPGVANVRKWRQSAVDRQRYGDLGRSAHAIHRQPLSRGTRLRDVARRDQQPFDDQCGQCAARHRPRRQLRHAQHCDRSDGLVLDRHPRSVATDTGADFWVAGGSGGVRFVPNLGASTSSDLTSSTFGNVRQLQIFGAQLYASSASGTTFNGIDAVGSGLPTSGQQTVTRLTLGAGTSAHGFFLADLDSGVPGPDTLYIADDGTALSKFSLVGGTWVANGSVGTGSDSYRGLTGSVSGSSVSLFATRNGGQGASGGGQLVTLSDTSGYNAALTATPTVLATAATNTAFRGVALAPTGACSGGGSPPTISSPIAISGALGDTTNPSVDVSIADDSTPANTLALTATATSNPSVAPLANVSITGSGGQRTIRIQPAGVGYADITLSVSDSDGLSSSAILHYAASTASTTPSTSRYLLGSSDASTAIGLDADLMLVADDEDQVLRLYQRKTSGLPLASFDFTSSLGLTDSTSGGVPREVDIEASARAGNRLYWLGSASNSSDGKSRPNRQRVFATDIAGSGASTTLSYVGRYDHLKDDLIAWDTSNAHGLGANHYGLAASAAANVLPEAPDGSGFNIEGLEFAPGSTSTAYVAFRAPISPTANRVHALIVPVTNFATLVSGNPSSGPAAFGAPIELDLGGRGIREIRKNAAGQYLISAGLAASGADFRLYSWTGNPTDAPLARIADLSGIASSGSIESIVEVPSPLDDHSVVQLVSDNGDTVFYGDGVIAKDLGQPNFKKSRADQVNLGSMPVRIHDIQGAAHLSPHTGEAVTDVFGIVTALRSNGFYLQDPQPDDNPATSEGIFVFTSSAPRVAVGDALRVSGTVAEFRSGGATSTNLTTTEITSPMLATISSNNPLPDPVVIGVGGRVPPGSIVEDDATGDVETSGVFDADTDGIDFYESLESMRVQVNNAVVVGPTQVFGSGSSQNSEIDVLGDGGSQASLRSARGGIIVRPNDFNPERIILNDLITGGPKLAAAKVNDSFAGAIVGVMDYTFGNYKLEVATLPAQVDGGLTRTVAEPAGEAELTLAGFNVENLSPADPPAKFANLATLIVHNLGAPDLVAVEEIQDNTGATDDGVVDASATYTQLKAAIVAAGGPMYDVRQIDPQNDRDGGQPGGNIRQAFLFRTDRGLAFVTAGTPSATTPTTIDVDAEGQPHLSVSPGRIEPANPAWQASRKPLAGEFTYHGNTLFVIANHLVSKSGDDPLFGRDQPPTEVSKAQRTQQAQLLHTFVQSILTADAAANVVVLGDLNDYQFSGPLGTLTAGQVLTDLVDKLPENERYSYDFQGNSQTLDHILTTSNLTAVSVLQPVHVNAEFPDQASDHDPMLARIHLPVDTTPPQIEPLVQGTLGGGGWYTSGVRVTWAVSDPQSKVKSTSGCEPGVLDADTPGATLTCTAASPVGVRRAASP